MPATVRVAPRHEREALGVDRQVRARARRAPRASAGPTRATVAHCSVTEVQSHAQVRPLGLQPLLDPVQHGAALPVVVVVEEAVVGAGASTVPSSKTIPSARHITP